MNPSSVATAVPPGYDFVRPIGAGGMGEVVLVRHCESGALVAVKFLAPSRVEATATAGRRFAREARLMTEFDHPNVVRVLDRGRVAGRDFLVMEYVDGPSLRDRLTPDRPMPLAEARRLLAGLAAALGYLESQGVVHRDLKPENVLLAGVRGQSSGVRDTRLTELTPDSGFPTPKITDFGIAAATEDASLTTTGEVLGTYDYMAPEQRARLPVDARADQYAFAVIAYEMLTGRRPVGTFKLPSKLNPILGPSVDVVLSRALQEDPDDRFPNAATFHAELDRALTDHRNRWPRVLVASAAAVVMTVIVWAFLPASHSGSAKEGKEGTVASSSPTPAKAEVQNDDVLNAHLTHAFAHKKRGEYDNALVEIDAALVLAPGRVDVLIGRGSILSNLKRYDEAIAALDEAIRRDQKAAEALAWRGWAYSHRPQPDFEKARADYDEAIRLGPDLAVAYHFRALFWRSRNDWVRARDDFVQAVRIEPDHILAHGMLAQIFASTAHPEVSDPKKAVEHGKRACELSRWADWRQMRALAYAYAADKQYAEAVALCERLLPLIHDDKLEQDVRKQMDGYRKRLAPGSKGAKS